MKRCWLHIGMHKTGTTSVQKTLAAFPNPQGWKYITLGKPNMASAHQAMFATQPHECYWFKQRGESPEQVARKGSDMRRKLAEAIEQCDAENLIISSETLSHIDPDGISRLRDFLKPLCDEIRVIGYVRPPAGFKVSYFQQRLKVRRVGFQLAKLKLAYRERFEKFDEVFGKENVSLRVFDPASFSHNCVVRDFCGQIGIELPPEHRVVRVNESLSREACGILYAYRKYADPLATGMDVHKANKMVIAPLVAMKGNRFRFSKRVVRASLAKESEDLAWMESRLGQPLQEEYLDDGTGVDSEGDLIRIEASSCLDFAARFREIHGLPLPDGMIPAQSPVAPRVVAELLAHCHGLCLAHIREKAVEKSRSRPTKRRFVRSRTLRRSWRYIKKLATAGSTRGS